MKRTVLLPIAGLICDRVRHLWKVPFVGGEVGVGELGKKYLRLLLKGLPAFMVMGFLPLASMTSVLLYSA